MTYQSCFQDLAIQQHSSIDPMGQMIKQVGSKPNQHLDGHNKGFSTNASDYRYLRTMFPTEKIVNLIFYYHML